MDLRISFIVFATLSVHTVCGLSAHELGAFDSRVQINESGDSYDFITDGFPPHSLEGLNDIYHPVQGNHRYNISISPDNEGDQIWCVNKGPIGYLTNGVAIYSALTKPGHDAVHYEDFDDCQGHTSPTGVYHYHKFSSCVANLNDTDKFLGVALDGNPIYGPKASDFSSLITSADLDACHGRFKDGRYRYHITADFPYTLGCYKAEPAGNNSESGADCTNTDLGAELCDCNSGMLTKCTSLREDSEVEQCMLEEMTTSLPTSTASPLSVFNTMLAALTELFESFVNMFKSK